MSPLTPEGPDNASVKELASMNPRLLNVFWICALLALAGCTEVTQSAEDCTDNQFFDLNAGLCRTCPSLEPPSCPDGCGFSLETDERGCQEAVCDCEVCQEGQFFDDDVLACVECPEMITTCGEGCQVAGIGRDEDGCQATACTCETICNPAVEADTGQCEACPETSVPECADGQALSNTTDGDGCPVIECAGGGG